MDALEPVPMKRRLEVTIDLFKGCAQSCSGCMIDTDLGGSVEDLVEVRELVREMVGSGWVAYDMGVGPTDYMSADNRDEVMDHPVFQELAQMFMVLTYNAAFLDKDMDKYTQMCEDIDRCTPDKPIRFLIPAAPYSFRSEKFGKMIVEKLEHVKKHLKVSWLREAGFVVNCTMETMGEDYKEMLLNGLAIDFPVEKDDNLNIPYGRGSTKDIRVAERIKRMSHLLSEYYADNGMEGWKYANPDLCFNTGTQMELLLTGGKLYWVPFLKDACAFVDDAFSVPKPWTMDNLLKARQDNVEASLDYLSDTECMDCPYLPSCIDKGITSIMYHLSIKDCLVGLDYV